MGVIGDIPNVNVFNTVSSLSLLFCYECRELIKILGEVVIVVDKIGVPESHQVGNELVIGVYWVVLLRGRHVVITSGNVSSVTIVSGAANSVSAAVDKIEFDINSYINANMCS